MKTPSRATLSRVAAVAVPLLLLLTLSAWAFASPVGSSPDDDFHLASIWCGIGLRQGICEESGNPTTRLVPAALLDAACYMFDSAISGACWDPTAAGLGEATWLNANALYPPLFYATMSLFVGPDVQTSVLLMRLANAAFAVGLLTCVFFALPRMMRPALLVSALVTTVPLGLFILASNNPSSWALLSAATVWVCMFGALRTTGTRQVILCLLTIFGAIIGAGARADAAAFAAFGIVLALILGARRSRSIARPALAGGIVLITAASFFLGARQGGSVTAGLPIESTPLTTPDHISNILGIPGLWLGAFGSAPLGWLDTSLPMVVPVLAFAAFSASLAIGIREVGWRRGIALASCVASLWLTPFVLLAQSDLHVADNLVQPRYILPLLVILAGVATASSHAAAAWSATRIAVVGAALSVAGSLSLHINIRRYTTGADVPSMDPGANAEWWWEGLPSPLAVWIIGSIAFALAFALLAVVQSRTPRAESSTFRSAEVQTPGDHAVHGIPRPRRQDAGLSIGDER